MACLAFNSVVIFFDSGVAIGFTAALMTARIHLFVYLRRNPGFIHLLEFNTTRLLQVGTVARVLVVTLFIVEI